jgi:hypothetical protein
MLQRQAFLGIKKWLGLLGAVKGRAWMVVVVVVNDAVGRRWLGRLLGVFAGADGH